jgi:hypothetical protein
VRDYTIIYYIYQKKLKPPKANAREGNNPKKKKKKLAPMKNMGKGGHDAAAIAPVAITPAPSPSSTSPPPIPPHKQLLVAEGSGPSLSLPNCSRSPPHKQLLVAVVGGVVAVVAIIILWQWGILGCCCHPCLVTPHPHPMSSCSWWWLGVLLQW